MGRRQRCLIEPVQFACNHKRNPSVTSQISTEPGDGLVHESDSESMSVSASLSFDEAFAYPAAVEVRNTFLEPLPDCFAPGPNFRSAPPRLETATWTGHGDDVSTQLTLDESPVVRISWSSEVDDISDAPVSQAQSVETFAVANDSYHDMMAPFTLCLDTALAVPSYVPLPSVGSVGHQAGTCKPCAFLHSRGCAEGPACEFCHLCSPDERKNRRKQKVVALREARRVSR